MIVFLSLIKLRTFTFSLIGSILVFRTPPSGSVVKNPPAVQEMGSSPGLDLQRVGHD